jgi:hypothetical protein
VIAWLIGAITLILVVLILGRRSSSAIRRKSEQPKYQFLSNIGVDEHAVKQQQMKENEKDTPKPNPERRS